MKVIDAGRKAEREMMTKGVQHNFIPTHEVLKRYDQQLASLTHKWVLQTKPLSRYRKLIRWLKGIWR